MRKFLGSMKIGKRVGLGFAFVLILSVAIITPVVLSQIEETIHSAEQRELDFAYSNIAATLDEEGSLAESLSVMVANLPTVQKTFAERDREALLQQLLPLFKIMKEQYGVEQFQFHTPPATSFLRLHKPEKFGDDLSAIRTTVVETNRNRQPINGLETGVAGLGIRGVVPVYHEGQHIGSVEFGQPLTRNFLTSLRKSTMSIWHCISSRMVVLKPLPRPLGKRHWFRTSNCRLP